MASTAPQGKEEDAANFLAYRNEARWVLKLAKTTIGNVIGVVGEGEPVILLCGHMDTVAGHMPLRIEEGKIYARGAVDAKGPLAAMIMAAVQAGKEPGFKGKILVASVVEEEATSRGVKPPHHSGHQQLTTQYSVNPAESKTSPSATKDKSN